MYASKITPLTGAAVALVAVLTLGACGKKIDDAKTTPMTPAPMSGASITPPPTVPASGSTN